mgnify:CR=1 FL=1
MLGLGYVYPVILESEILLEDVVNGFRGATGDTYGF